jgi:hypothetical protein
VDAAIDIGGSITLAGIGPGRSWLSLSPKSDGTVMRNLL